MDYLADVRRAIVGLDLTGEYDQMILDVVLGIQNKKEKRRVFDGFIHFQPTRLLFIPSLAYNRDI